MRTPTSIGLPDHFPEWRKGQDKLLKDLLFSESRFSMLTSPTGSGKSVTYMGLAAIRDKSRVVVLTATKALQDQLLRDFESIGLVDMRGRQNYDCAIAENVSAADATCTWGNWCEYTKEPGCPYYDQRRTAKNSRLVVTNYSYWLCDSEVGAIGGFDVLVLDEAHATPDQISEYAAVEVEESLLRKHKLSLPTSGYKHWAVTTVERIERKLGDGEVKNSPRLKVELWRLQRDLARLCRLSEQDWVMSTGSAAKGSNRWWRWDLIDPGALAEEMLFRGAKQIVLTSASVRRKTLELLGVDQDVRITEQDSPFPVRRRPIYYWPAANVRWNMKDAERMAWVDAIDDIIEDRLDRKGIIHSVSYDRAWEFVRASRHRHRWGFFLVDSKKKSTAELVAEFKQIDGPCVLISPAVGTGLDFPYKQLEYQVIAKVPFPDMSAPIIKARQERDKTYSSYAAFQTIVQQTGRGMRAEDDQCETFIVDSNFGWLRAGHWDFAPRWWHVAVRSVKEPPDPLPVLD